MPSFKSFLYYHLTKRALARFRSLNLPITQARLAREEQSARVFKMPSGVVIEPADVAGVGGEWLRPTAPGQRGIVLYLHGGAYVFGSTITHRGIAARLAIASGAAVLVINYRLAPENPFPAGLDDALVVYKELLQAYPDAPIGCAGDSAGGGLALALSLRIRDAELRAPAALALMSPWTDLTLSNPTHREKSAVDPYFPDSGLLMGAAKAYAAETPLDHPEISPQFANLSGMPDTLIHVGEREALLDDSRLLAQTMAAHGSTATLKRYAGMWHVWQTLAGRMREADESIADLGDFLRRRIGAGTN